MKKKKYVMDIVFTKRTESFILDLSWREIDSKYGESNKYQYLLNLFSFIIIGEIFYHYRVNIFSYKYI